MKNRIFAYLILAVSLASCLNAELAPKGDELLPPNLSILEPAPVEQSLLVTFSAKLEGGISSENCGFYFSRDEKFSDSEKVSKDNISPKDGLFSYTKMLTGYGEKWYVRAYSSNGRCEIMSASRSYTVNSFASYVWVGKPEVVFSQTDAVVLSYLISYADGVVPTDCGLCYAPKQTDLSVDGEHVSSTKESGVHTSTIEGLTAGNNYFVCAYVRENDNIVYGDACSFTAMDAPTVTTGAISNITSSSATVGGNVTSDGGSSVTERGVVWSTSQNPTTSSNKKSVGSGTGSFTADLSGLSVATTYYVRAYAINSMGTSYGEQKSFKTGASSPTVTTGTISNITSSSATVGGNITSDGGSSVTERGVVWSTSQNPTTSSNKKSVGSGTGSFTADLSGLSVATTYYVRAYAINSMGTSYGEQKSFKTGAIPVTSVSLSQSSLTLEIGESYTLYVTVLPSNATDKSVTWSSSKTSVASVASTGQVTGKAAGTCSIIVKSSNGLSASCTVTVLPSDDTDTEDLDKYDYEFDDGLDAVDLGLSVKWASCNLGASKPEEYGGYYQWARLEDVSSTSIYLDWSNCPYHSGSSYSTGWTKYIPSGYSSYWSGGGSPDNKTVLDPEDDAVHVALGGKWRTPTRAEFDELINNCDVVWTTLNGVNGRKFTSKKTGYADKWIFLPAAGYRSSVKLNYVGSYGYYWSSSLSTGSPSGAYDLDFNSGNVDTSSGNRYDGQSVRPVSE